MAFKVPHSFSSPCPRSCSWWVYVAGSMYSLSITLWVFSQSSNWIYAAIKNVCLGTSLVAQWLRICLPVQGTQVRSLVREDSKCHGAAKPVHDNSWACDLEPMSHKYWAHVPQLLKPTRLEPMLLNKRSHCNEKPAHHNEE